MTAEMVERKHVAWREVHDAESFAIPRETEGFEPVVARGARRSAHAVPLSVAVETPALTHGSFAEEAQPCTDVRGALRVGYTALGALWLAAGAAVLAFDNASFHAFDALGGIPELAAAFGLYHGYKLLAAAGRGHTYDDLTVRGTWREVKGHAHRVIEYVKEKLFSKRPQDLRCGLTLAC